MVFLEVVFIGFGILEEFTVFRFLGCFGRVLLRLRLGYVGLGSVMLIYGGVVYRDGYGFCFRVWLE